MRQFREKMFLTVVLATALLFSFSASVSAQACQPVAPDLVSWWSGDGDALDARSRNNGSQMTASYTAGKSGGAFEFNGSQSVLVGNHSSLQPASITVETWILKYGTPANVIEDIFAKWGFDARLDSYLFGVYQEGRRLKVFGAIGDGVTGDPGFSGGTIRLNLWTHLAMTYNVADGLNKLYVDGNLVQSRYRPGGIYPTVSNAYAGREDSGNPRNFWGRIDELAIYRRALSDAEIQAVYNAGTAGKCRATATVTPPGLAGFWTGDGRADDMSGNNNHGALFGSTKYTLGKVGQGFDFDGFGDFVSIPPSSNQNIDGPFSAEAWIFPRVVGGTQHILSSGYFGAYWALYLTDINQPLTLRAILSDGTSAGTISVASPAGALTLNQWNHVAFTHTYSGTSSVLNLYINGVQVSGGWFPPVSVVNNNGLKLGLGNFNGMIDEAAIYRSELSATEIQSIYNAGRAGKLKAATTPVGGFYATLGEASVNIPNVTRAGTTQVIPLDLATFPALPPGFSHTRLFYDVATSAAFTGGNASACFEVPVFQTEFSNLRIMKYENGGWTDVTAWFNAYPTLCTSGLSTLSPMAIVY